MLKYFFKLAFRNIKKNKTNTFISMIGLVVGLTSFILISSYVNHELSFNKYNSNYDNIFISKVKYHMPEGIVEGSSTPYPVVETLISEYPEVKFGVRFASLYAQIKNEENNKSFFEDNARFVDNDFINIFSVNVLYGDKENPLSEPNTIVLTKKIASKYFDDENPVGKTLLYDGKTNIKVTALIDDLPVNSDFRYDFFVSLKTLTSQYPYRDYSQRWDNNQFQTVFLLNKSSDYVKLNEKLKDFFENRYSDIAVKRELALSPLSKYHLKKNEDDNSLRLLIIFSINAVLILVIACINFINLSIANAANRVKETSIRRIVGSKRSTLILQQVGESVLLSFISFDLAYLLTERLLPDFNAIIGTQIPSNIIFNIPFILGMFLSAILLGIISGIFPAIKIGRIQPIQVLSGKSNKIDQTGLSKKGLIVFQYSISIILIIATLILSKQFRFIKNRDLGFNSKHLLTANVGIKNKSDYPKLNILKNEISSLSGVENIALSRTLPFYGTNSTTVRKLNAAKEDIITVNYNVIEKSFFETYNIDVLKDNESTAYNNQNANNTVSEFLNLDQLLKKETKEYENDIAYCSINKAAEEILDFYNPIGERILLWDMVCEIVGVHQDYHVNSVQEEIQPQVLVLGGDVNTYDRYIWMTIKCNADNLKEIKEKATNSLREIFPDHPYSFFYYGDTDFKSEVLIKVKGIEKLFGVFTFIAIIIASMGIFGLVALTVKNKTKEIGIRKTLGSSVFEIYRLIAKEYLLLAILGNIAAWYPAWYISNKILQDFAYRVEISLWVFVLGFISSILLTIITIAFHTIKAARTNPVDALRYE